jgi:outer membrane lipoprotein carrier protein
MTNKLAVLAALLLPVSLSAQSADAILDRAVSKYSQLRSVRAEFKQTLTNPLTGTTATTSGTLLRKKPNLLDISFDNGDRIVADGINLWIYLPSSVPGQVIRQSARAAATSTFDPAGEFLTSPRARYVASAGGTSSVSGRASHLVTLTPKSPSAPFSKVKLWVDDADNTVRQFEVSEKTGVQRLILITRLAMNPPLARSSFRFTPPKGARVVEQPLQRIN